MEEKYRLVFNSIVEGDWNKVAAEMSQKKVNKKLIYFDWLIE